MHVFWFEQPQSKEECSKKEKKKTGSPWGKHFKVPLFFQGFTIFQIFLINFWKPVKLLLFITKLKNFPELLNPAFLAQCFIFSSCSNRCFTATSTGLEGAKKTAVLCGGLTHLFKSQASNRSIEVSYGLFPLCWQVGDAYCLSKVNLAPHGTFKVTQGTSFNSVHCFHFSVDSEKVICTNQFPSPCASTTTRTSSSVVLVYGGTRGRPGQVLLQKLGYRTGNWARCLSLRCGRWVLDVLPSLCSSCF